MRCPACQAKLKRNIKICSHCGEIIEPPQSFKKFNRILPGFRTGKRYKKILACFMYIFIIIFILSLFLWQPITADETAKTIFLHYLRAIVDVVFCIFIPFILCTNFMGIRNRLPFFKAKKRSKTILATCVVCIFWLVTYASCAQGLSIAQFQSFSPEKQAAMRSANETRQKEAAMIASAKAEEKALKEQQDQSEKRKQQEKAQADAQEKAKNKEEQKKQKALEKEYNNIDKAYEDSDVAKLKSLAQTVSGDAYAYLIQRCQEDYHKLLNTYRSELNAKNYASLRSFKDSIQYLSLGFPELQQIANVSQKAAEILEQKEASGKLYSGNIKSESSLIHLDVYVDYRIKNSNTSEFLDEYKISSYDNGYWGEIPNSDWEAVLASGDNVQEGVLQSWAISTTTKSYITGDGFKKSYEVYKLVSDQEVDAFHASLDKQEGMERKLQTLWAELQKMLV